MQTPHGVTPAGISSPSGDCTTIVVTSSKEGAEVRKGV